MTSLLLKRTNPGSFFFLVSLPPQAVPPLPPWRHKGEGRHGIQESNNGDSVGYTTGMSNDGLQNLGGNAASSVYIFKILIFLMKFKKSIKANELIFSNPFNF